MFCHVLCFLTQALVSSGYELPQIVAALHNEKKASSRLSKEASVIFC
jgi:hypothetical protein